MQRSKTDVWVGLFVLLGGAAAQCQCHRDGDGANGQPALALRHHGQLCTSLRWRWMVMSMPLAMPMVTRAVPP